MRGWRKIEAVLALAVISLSANGCGGVGAYTWVNDYAGAETSPVTDAIITEGDVVAVRVFGQEAMSAQATIGSNGTIAVPLIGEVPVAGMTTAAASLELQKRAAPFVNEPKVTVVILQSQTRVVVAGEVRRPGTVVLDGATGVLAALANAGGLTEFADGDRVFVLRATPAGTQRIRFRYEELERGVPKATTFQLRTGDQVVAE